MKKCENIELENALGYERVRIPGIICLDSGTLISYFELRMSAGDWSVIDIGMRKSTDGGKTWSKRKILVSGENENTVNNPLMIADNGTVHFLYCVNYHNVFYMKSIDEGESWSSPLELTKSIREQTKDFFWTCIATGPTHGIRLSSGRLLVPVWLAYNKDDEKSHHPSVISTLYSDDGGESWKSGKIFSKLCDPSEFAVAELENGRVIANIRHENTEKCRATGEINENAEIVNVHFFRSLPDPVCCAGLCSFGNELFFTNCENESERKDLTLKRICDESISEKLYLSETAGYSDVCITADKEYVIVIYEHEKTLRCIRIFLK